MTINQTLTGTRLTRIVQALQDTRGIPANLQFLARTPMLMTDEDEILGEWDGKVFIADLVADDFEATTHDSGRIVQVVHAVPNIKHGTSLTQKQITELVNLSKRTDLRDDVGYTNSETQRLDRLRTGILQRMEMLTVAMWTNGLSMGTYNRRGVQISGVTWRNPSSLAVTAGTVITNTAAATPVATTIGVQQNAQVQWGQVFNRIDMSTPLFQAMIATDEFKAKAALYLPQTITYANLVASNLGQQRTLAENVLGMTINLYDATYAEQANDGTTTYKRFLPTNLAVLSNTMNDGDANVQRFGMSEPTEVVVSQVADIGLTGSLPTDSNGIVSYAVGTHNPPSLTYWAAARGFPIKYSRTAHAVIDFNNGAAITDPVVFVANP